MNEFKLVTERLIVRNWQEQDRDLFFLINSDEQVMEFFPFRRNRKQSDQMMDQLRESIHEKGYGWTALAERNSNVAIGFCGLADVEIDETFPEATVEIGWRLSPEYWGMGYATEAAHRLIKFGFEELKLPSIVSFSVVGNHRSRAVMERIGMKHKPQKDFDHPNISGTSAHLARHVVYEINNPTKKGA